MWTFLKLYFINKKCKNIWIEAVGSAYAYKRKQNSLITVVYFGDGAASEGDAHTAMNFASVYDVPMIFFW